MPRPMCPLEFGGIAMRSQVRRTEARKVVRHFFTRLSTALVTLLPSFRDGWTTWPRASTEVRRTEARKVVHHFFTRLSTALVTLLPSFDSNFSGRLSNPKQCFQVSLSTS